MNQFQDRIRRELEHKYDDGIKIIQRGDLSLLRKYKRFTCDKCGCIWEADKDHYKYSGNQIDGDNYCCSCPTCGAITYDR